MRRLRPLIALICVAVLAAAAACTAGEEESILDKDVLRIGVRYNLPLVGEQTEDGGYRGFDIDVAEYIAAELGAEVEFVKVDLPQRREYLLEDRIDLAVAIYSITQERKQHIDFAGPYVVEPFDVLALEGFPADDLGDLTGRTFCEVEGSNAIERIQDELGLDAEVMVVADYQECLDALVAGEADVVATDQFGLAGLAYSNPDLGLEILNIPFSRERIGVGMQPGDTAGCEAINRAITKMYDDGVAAELLAKWFAPAGIDVSEPQIPQFEGCE